MWFLKTDGPWQQIHLQWSVGQKLFALQDRWILMAAVSQDRVYWFTWIGKLQLGPGVISLLYLKPGWLVSILIGKCILCRTVKFWYVMASFCMFEKRRRISVVHGWCLPIKIQSNWFTLHITANITALYILTPKDLLAPWACWEGYRMCICYGVTHVILRQCRGPSLDCHYQQNPTSRKWPKIFVAASPSHQRPRL